MDNASVRQPPGNGMNKALVSVVMPAYNHERFVAAAIESVLGQTWPNLELIVVDDASQDRTWDVISGHADSRIRASRHAANQGAHITLNEALGMARGAFVAIINSDDVFAPTRIAACLETLRNTGADLVGSDIILIDAAGEPLVEHWWVRAFARPQAAPGRDRPESVKYVPPCPTPTPPLS